MVQLVTVTELKAGVVRLPLPMALPPPVASAPLLVKVQLVTLSVPPPLKCRRHPELCFRERRN